jgi:hypothetical protein
MAYNLPPPWQSGYALPKNVRDEGIERRAFITKMAPRGTYDQPNVGTGGYAVPSYVMDEGYGQGTFTTKWQPSGAYNGPKVPNWLNRRPQVIAEKSLPGGAKVVTVQPLGADDAPLPALYEDYGAKAAGIIIDQVSRLPPAQRASVMKAYMNKLDPSLWGRTQTIWKRYVAQGAEPAQAFPLALARAMSAGLAAEIVDTGIRRVAPQTNSLLGLGCYGRVRGALGDAASVVARLQQLVGKRVIAGYLAPPVAAKTKWTLGGFAIDNDWPIPVWTNAAITQGALPPAVIVPTIKDLTPDQIVFLRTILTQDKDSAGRTDSRVHYTDGSDAYGNWPPEAVEWFHALGIEPDDTLRLHNLWYFKLGAKPLAWAKDPRTGNDVALHVRLGTKKFRSPVAADNPVVIQAWVATNPDKSWWTQVYQSVAEIPMLAMALDPTGLTPAVVGGVTKGIAKGAGVAVAVGEAVHDKIDDLLKDATCAVLKSQAGPVAGAAAAAYVGAPPQAGVKGAQIGAQMCGATPPAPLPMPVVPSSSVLPLALVAGGVLVTAVLLSKRKKNHP